MDVVELSKLKWMNVVIVTAFFNGFLLLELASFFKIARPLKKRGKNM